MLQTHRLLAFHRFTAGRTPTCLGRLFTVVPVLALALGGGCSSDVSPAQHKADPGTTPADAGETAGADPHAGPRSSDASTSVGEDPNAPCADGETDDTCAHAASVANDAGAHDGTPPAGPSECGDGVVDALEQCDPGHPTAGATCTDLCTLNVCGDGELGSDEECDDGATGSDACSDESKLIEPGAGPDPNRPINCGDGLVGDDEICDDANLVDGDGCASNCSQEPGFSCAAPGNPCIPIAPCGDAIVATSEQCDDGAKVSGDGCSEQCKLEKGMKCSGAPSVCEPVTCGDAITEGSEGCDDGNTLPFDGCSASCEREPSCTQGSACTSTCGDGVVQGEQCDDGNLLDGDGCSSLCVTEPTFSCEVASAPCEQLNGECVLRLAVIYRDHSEAHPDFGPIAGECSRAIDESGERVAAQVLTKGLVLPQLDAEGRPQLASDVGIQACDSGADVESYTAITQFADWFRDADNAVVVPRTLLLFQNGDGSYVNRFREDGTQFLGYADETGSGEGDFTCSWCLDGDCQDRCIGDEVMFDGTPLFFPVDDITGPTADPGPAKIPAEYGYAAGPWEADVSGADEHNFYFTSEFQFSFAFDAATNATLEIMGDDDVWVYVNGVLAIDLGGLHMPQQGSVTLNAQSASTFGLLAGNVYSLSIFHAERGLQSSSFRLRLSGFEAASSQCQTACGDGILGVGEECDDGVNDGGYGECLPDCRLGEFCGDGVINGPEHCDPGASGSTACPGCRVPRLR